MAIIFRYEKIPREDGTLRKAPYIPILIRNRFGKLMNVVALLDSGADNTVMPKDLAQLIGLKEEKTGSGKTGGIGGEVAVKKSRLHFTVGSDREKYNISVPVLVLQDQNSEDVPLLLGRTGFFEHFHITFKQNEEKIVLKKIETNRKY